MSRHAARSAALVLLALGLPASLRAQAAVPARPASPAAPAADAGSIFRDSVAAHLEAEKGGEHASALFDKAVRGYREVIRLRPDAAAAWYNLARAQESLGDLDGAAGAFARAAGLPGPDQPFYLRESADHAAARGRWREAEDAYERLVLLEPRLDAPHALLVERRLAEGESNPGALLDYAWKLVAAGQSSRAADLALSALERGWPGWLRPELLTVVAAALGQQARAPAEVLRSVEVRRLEMVRGLPEIRAGVDELLAIYETPGAYAAPFRWWNAPDDGWEDARGVSRREAARSMMRSLGDAYRDRGEAGVADACYRAAVDLAPDPDPVALRRLASSYVAQGKLEAIDVLAARYADPAGALFQGKQRAYQEGALEKILSYHQALGEIYGSLAESGVKDWGDTRTPNTALFQLDRAFTTAKRLDEESPSPPVGGVRKSHVDADLTVLLAEGLETKAAKLEAAGAVTSAKEHRDRALRVRVEAASKLDAGGDRRGVEKVTRGVDVRELPPADRKRIEVYRGVEPPPEAPPPDGGKQKAIQQLGPAPAQESKYPTKLGRTGMMAQTVVAPTAVPRMVQVPATAEWLDTGIVLAAGQALTITASGRWSNAGAPDKGPEGFAGYLYPGTIVADAPLASLVARVGGATFHVGPAFRGASPAAGTLFLAINDVAGTFGDNQGALEVVVQTE